MKMFVSINQVMHVGVIYYSYIEWYDVDKLFHTLYRSMYRPVHIATEAAIARTIARV